MAVRSDEATAATALPAWRRRAASLAVGGSGAFTVPLLGAVLLFLYPLVTSDQYWIRQLSLIGVLSLVVSGINLTYGYAGEIQFGQVFLFAVGAYLATALSTRLTDELVPLLLLGGLAATVVAAAIALPAVRVGGWALAIASFYLVISLPSFLRPLSEYTGGYEGIPVPQPVLFGSTLTDEGLFEVLVVVAVIWFAAYRNLVRSRYGVIFRILRESRVLTSSLGFSPTRLKVLAYALSGFPAGVAGVLYAYISQFLVPELFTVTVAIALIAAAVVGGVESVYGAIVGAALLQLGPMSSLAFQQYATAAYGAFLIVAGIVFRRGLGGLGVAAGRRVSHWLAPEGHVDPSIAAGYSEFHSGSGRPDAATELVAKRAAAPAREGRQLEVDGVSKRFAGVHALKDVTLTAPAGEVTGLIGSNGSGKTTLLNVICGYVKADAGAVQYGDARLIGLGPHQVASEAVGRTFQTPSIPRGVSVLDVIASGRFSSHKVGVASSILRLPPYWRAHREDRRAAAAALELVGLLDVAEEEAGKQPLGTRRLIEVARMLCSDATLLLLDEPASGLADEEVRRLGEVVRSAADAGATVLLIEHNFGFVTSVSDTVHVLHFGERIASGDAATIGHDPKVIESYLGTSQSEAPDVATSPGTRGE